MLENLNLPVSLETSRDPTVGELHFQFFEYGPIRQGNLQRLAPSAAWEVNYSKTFVVWFSQIRPHAN